MQSQSFSKAQQIKWIRFPSAIASLALGVSSLGWALENLFDSNGVTKWIGAIFALILILMLVAKIVSHPKLIWEEFSDPVLGTALSGLSMSLMVISHSFFSINQAIGISLWLLGIILHFTVLVLFLYRQIPVFQLNCINPSWFVPFVGVVTAAVSYPFSGDLQTHLHLFTLAKICLGWGMICYLILLPIMMYRLIWGAHLNLISIPSVAIMAAPGSLSLAGYLTLSAAPSPIVVSLLFGIASLMTITVYTSLIKLLSIPFTPGFSAYTFPLVISATAMFKLAHWLESLSVDLIYVESIRNFAKFELIIASLMVIYVLFCYLRYFYRIFHPKNQLG